MKNNDLRVKHKMSNTRPYNIYYGIRRRCYNVKDIGYARYGAKGIFMSKDWQTFEGFCIPKKIVDGLRNWNSHKIGGVLKSTVTRVKKCHFLNGVDT